MGYNILVVMPSSYVLEKFSELRRIIESEYGDGGTVNVPFDTCRRILELTKAISVEVDSWAEDAYSQFESDRIAEVEDRLAAYRRGST